MSKRQREGLDAMTRYLVGWNGQMKMDSASASIYMYTLFNFYKSLFYEQIPDRSDAVGVFDQREAPDATYTLLKSIDELGPESKFQKICKGAYPNYNGKDICAYNMAKAFIETISFLESNVSEDKYKWKWGMLLTREWPNLPWSRTPLKFLFHRTASGSGNGNTPNFAKFSYRSKLDQVKF